MVAILAGVFLMAVPVVAQDTVGSLAGTITQASDGAALPGVTVTIRNAAGQELVAVTDEDGDFRFPVVTVGAWTVTAALDGFQTLEESGIMVSVGGTRRINMSMPEGSVEETILVTSEAPMVDISSTVTGVTINTGDFAEKVPVARDTYQVALIAPGTTTGDSAFDGRTPGQSLTSLGGASVAENTYLVNGLNITNFRNGLGGSTVPFEFVQEVQVKTGGYEAEFGRSTGGVLNMVTKSGSNNWHGGVNIYFNPESMQGTQPDYFNGLNSEEYYKRLEGNLTAGGALWKDRIFFYGFYQYNDVEFSGVSLTRETVTVRDDPYYGGKLDLNLTSNHRIEATYFTDEVDQGSDDYEYDADTRTRGDFVGSAIFNAGGENIVGKYTGIFGRSFVLAAQYGENTFNRNNISDGDAFPLIWDSRGDSTLFLGSWVNSQRGFADDKREAYRIDADYFIGGHSFRAGFDDETNTSNDLTQYSGNEYYRYFVNGSRFPQLPESQELTRYRIFEGGGMFDTLSSAWYVQDSWEIGEKWLVNLGVRVENFNNKNSLGESFIKVDNQVAPRLGFTYDRAGDGRSKVYGSYGRYHLYIASNTNIRLAGAELFTEDWYTLPGGCNLSQPTPDSCLGTGLEFNVFGDGTVPDPRATKSEKVDPMYQDEYVLGYEQMVGDNWSLGIRGVFREFGEVIEDLTIDAAMTAQGLPGFGAFEYRLANPGTDFDGFVDLHDGGGLIPFSATADELAYPAPERNYYAVDFTFNRRFTDNWMLQGSYTWAHSYGNYEGYVRSDNGQDDAGLTTLYDFSGLLDNGYGNLPNDRRTNFKIFGAYQFDMGLFLGAGATWRDGRPLQAFGVHPTDEFAALYGAESFFNQGTPVNRGSLGRTSDVTNIDLTVKYDWDIGRSTLTLRGDVFNIFDDSTAVEQDNLADEESGAVNTTFLEDTRFVRPRRVRFLVGLNF
jgi:hypothetical protein